MDQIITDFIRDNIRARAKITYHAECDCEEDHEESYCELNLIHNSKIKIHFCFPESCTDIKLSEGTAMVFVGTRDTSIYGINILKGRMELLIEEFMEKMREEFEVSSPGRLTSKGIKPTESQINKNIIRLKKLFSLSFSDLCEKLYLMNSEYN